MAKPKVVVSTEAMKQSAVFFEQTVNDSLKILEGVNTEVGSLMVTWKGEASASFNNVLSAWGDQFQKVCAELDAMKDTLLGNTVVYGANEYEQITISAGLDALLGDVV